MSFKRKKTISAFLFLAIAFLLFSSCKQDETNKNIWFPIDGEVTTLDPQSASTSDELLVIQNAMEGLVRKNLQGEIIPAMAERWDLSQDGRTYTFYLKENVKWDLTNTQKKIYQSTTAANENTAGSKGNENKQDAPEFNPDITAADFVFALQRACLPTTNAPYFNSISAIRGAVAAHSGQVPVSDIGVAALDDATLQITLVSPDDQFLDTLTTAIAMPCNQEFFNYTKGRYGLEKNLTLFNGPFFLSSWTKSRIVLEKSEIYNGETERLPLPSHVTLNVPEKRDNILPNLLKGTYDVALISGQDSKSITEKDGITLTPFESTVWGYVFNCDNAIMSNVHIRKALCYAFQTVNELEADYLGTPTGIVPISCNINDKSYRSYAGNASLLANDEAAAVTEWMAGLKELSPSELDLTILCTQEMAHYVKQGVQGLQKTLGNKVNYINKNNTEAGLALSIKIETVEEAVFTDRLKAGNYQVAFYPMEATDDSALKFLSQFQSDGYTGYASDSYDRLITRAEETRDAQAEASLLKECETELLSQAVVYPVLSESTYFAMAKGVSDIGFSTSGGKLNFVYAKRKD